MHINTSFVVSVDFSEKDQGVLIVGKQRKGKMDIVNAFQGKEAYDLFQKLINKPEEGAGNGSGTDA